MRKSLLCHVSKVIFVVVGDILIADEHIFTQINIYVRTHGLANLTANQNDSHCGLEQGRASKPKGLSLREKNPKFLTKW